MTPGPRIITVANQKSGVGKPTTREQGQARSQTIFSSLTDEQLACLTDAGLTQPQSRPTIEQRQALREAAADCGINVPGRPAGAGFRGARPLPTPIDTPPTECPGPTAGAPPPALLRIWLSPAKPLRCVQPLLEHLRGHGNLVGDDGREPPPALSPAAATGPSAWRAWVTARQSSSPGG